LRVEFLALWGGGGLMMDDNLGGFVIALNKDLSIDFWVDSLGHEIAHTFHYDIDPSLPVDLMASSDAENDAVEVYCDNFSIAWKLTLGEARIREFLSYIS
jgi:hypothetical protein